MDRFDTNDLRVVNDMMKHFAKIKLIRPETTTSVINRLNETKSELAKKGKVFINGELVGRLLDALTGDDRYDANVAALNTLPNVSYEDAVTQLRAITANSYCLRCQLAIGDAKFTAVMVCREGGNRSLEIRKLRSALNKVESVTEHSPSVGR